MSQMYRCPGLALGMSMHTAESGSCSQHFSVRMTLWLVCSMVYVNPSSIHWYHHGVPVSLHVWYKQVTLEGF